MRKRLSKTPPKDEVEAAHAVVMRLTGQQTDSLPANGKNPAAVALGLLGGRKGGLKRAKNLSAKRRKEIAKKAAKARWDRSRK